MVWGRKQIMTRAGAAVGVVAVGMAACVALRINPLQWVLPDEQVPHVSDFTNIDLLPGFKARYESGAVVECGDAFIYILRSSTTVSVFGESESEQRHLLTKNPTSQEAREVVTAWLIEQGRNDDEIRAYDEAFCDVWNEMMRDQRVPDVLEPVIEPLLGEEETQELQEAPARIEKPARSR